MEVEGPDVSSAHNRPGREFSKLLLQAAFVRAPPRAGKRISRHGLPFESLSLPQGRLFDSTAECASASGPSAQDARSSNDLSTGQRFPVIGISIRETVSAHKLAPFCWACKLLLGAHFGENRASNFEQGRLLSDTGQADQRSHLLSFLCNRFGVLIAAQEFKRAVQE